MELLTPYKKPLPSLAIPKPVIWLAKVLAFFSSALAAKFGQLLFTTPVNFSTPKREKYMYESAQKKRLIVPEIGKEIGNSPLWLLQKKGFIGAWLGWEKYPAFCFC